MKRPFFSVVIPTFNRSALFPLAVESILRQTFDDFEVIVSDNCSADETRQVAGRFADPRVKYVQTPRHFVIADSWEFARRQASGELILALSDDDALVATALARFAHESRRHKADFLFSAVAQYRDPSFPGAEKNSVDCPRFSGAGRVVAAEEFVRPLFSFRPRFDMHPSAYVFSKALADGIQERTGRFFWTNGVEFSAWPMSAVRSRCIVYVDAPLAILGRTAKSWGSNTQLCNPGKESIEAFFKDVDQERKHAPLNNFTTSNLMAEGMLTAKSLFPKEFAPFEFDEVEYLRSTMALLHRRQALGVDVAREIDDALRYAAKYPGLPEDLRLAEQPRLGRPQIAWQRLRETIGDLGARTLRRRVQSKQLACRLRRGDLRSGFWASGDDFGFRDVLGCAEFLDTQVLGHRNQIQPSSGPMAGAAAAQPERSVNGVTTA